MLINEEGRRQDGRMPDHLREISIKAGVLERADGSAEVRWGGTHVIASVHGPFEPRPRHLQDPANAVVKAYYRMAPFSVEDRKAPGFDRRSHEISLVLGETLSSVVFREWFPRTLIEVYIDVISADGGTRTAGLTAASVALADAGIPMVGLLPACSLGKLGGVVVVDPSKEEDSMGEADMPMALQPVTGEVILLQMDGRMSREELEEALEMGRRACMKIVEIQREALNSRYFSGEGGGSDE